MTVRWNCLWFMYACDKCKLILMLLHYEIQAVQLNCKNVDLASW